MGNPREPNRSRRRTQRPNDDPPSIIGFFASPEDAALLTEVVNGIFLRRSLSAHGGQLLEALESLLDWKDRGSTDEQAW